MKIKFEVLHVEWNNTKQQYRLLSLKGYSVPLLKKT